MKVVVRIREGRGHNVDITGPCIQSSSAAGDNGAASDDEHTNFAGCRTGY